MKKEEEYKKINVVQCPIIVHCLHSLSHKRTFFSAGRKILELGGNNAIIGELHILQQSFL